MSTAIRPHVTIRDDIRRVNVRPVIPRTIGAAPAGLVLFVTGSATSYRRYDTSVVVRRDPGLR